MPVIYAPAVRTARMQQVLAAIDAGGAAGKLRIYNILDSLLYQTSLSDPAGTVSGDVLTFSPIALANAISAGVAAKATITDSNDNLVVSGLSVGTAGCNINLGSVNLSQNAPVEITSASLTHNTLG